MDIAVHNSGIELTPVKKVTSRMFSQAAEYALRAMIYLAEHTDEPATSEAISVAMRVPKPYLSKVLRELVEAGLIGSTRGKNGGFVVTRPAEGITALQIVNAIDPIRRITQCPLGRPEHVKLCPLHQKMDSAIGQVEYSLHTTSLASLVEKAVAQPIRRSTPPSRRSSEKQ
jgi:Rrf2 family transcriptional regulator, nitric oxide-sensitive transcriptional repressor